MFNAVKPSLEKEDTIKFQKSIIVNEHKIAKKNMMYGNNITESINPSKVFILCFQY